MDAYRAPSLFQPHRAREAIQDAIHGKIQPLVGLYLGLSTVPTALFVAPMGWDIIWLDWEHSSCNTETMTSMVHSIMFASEGKTIPFVRVPGHDHAAIGFALDAGASIVVPQVETVEQAQHVVSSAKFGIRHKGTRSAPPFRLIPGLTDTPHNASVDIFENLNNQAAIMLQIETLAGIQNLDDILTQVKDIDSIWLGTLDARVSMGLPANGGMGGTEQEWVDAVKLFEETMAKHPNVAYAGFAFGDDETAKRLAKGKSLIVCAADVMALAGTMSELHRAKGLHGKIEQKTNGVEKSLPIVNKKEVPKNVNAVD